MDALFVQLLRLADDHLVLGHRLSEWCGHAPMLEEDLALPNIALDLIGQARALYSYAGEVEDAGRDEDQLAYWRLERDYTNALLCERPNGDFAHTMVRQLFFSAFMQPFWQAALNSSDNTLKAIAGKAVKESAYHIRHSAEWVIRLGDGTAESAQRTVDAVDLLSPYVAELFVQDNITESLASAGVIANPLSLHEQWLNIVKPVFSSAKLQLPDTTTGQLGGRSGIHTEDFGFLLAELQYVQRAHPGLTW